MKTKQNLVLLALVLLSVLCATCGNMVTGGGIASLDGKEILSATNTSRFIAEKVTFSYYDRSVERAGLNSGQSALLSREAGFTLSPPQGILRKDRDIITRFNAELSRLPHTRTASRPSRLESPKRVGDRKSFWVDKGNHDWQQIPATVQAQGSYCNIWVADDIYNTGSTNVQINPTEARMLAAKFDAIYPLATNLLGYEMGGGPGGNGGIDGDNRIQIFVHDIYSYDPGVVGYFWSKDEHEDGYYPSLPSNEMEVFYIDSYYFNLLPNEIYSTLIHEFQHMIHFNQKGILSEEWYNEMLSALAEDVIGPLVGINNNGSVYSGHVIDSRIPDFLDYYWALGVQNWDGNLSYSTVYAFGAYLIRNYGGPALIREMLSNNAINATSVTWALQKFDRDNSFAKALERYGEALVYSSSVGGTSGKVSFDKTVTSTINGQSYTAKGFDIWTMKGRGSGETASYRSEYRALLWNDYGWDITKGPVLYPCLNEDTIDTYGLCLYAVPLDWTGGRFSVTASPSSIKTVVHK